ncbi:DUF2357 domain-containing protein [Vibrio sp. 1F255]|uniref:DUF2357 domain-containing protein n=1 Tax=Vibrio sp. 1F255 TaxID=3230009 RepID=UPI00352C6001
MSLWYDRLEGRFTKRLPSVISPSQFAVTAECEFNSHSVLSAGQAIVNDGTDKFHFQSIVGSFDSPEVGGVNKTELNIIESALFAYKEAVDDGNTASFLISETLLSRFDLGNFEQLLHSVLAKGHLQEIARRPRMELVYEEYLVPVSRAKKLAANATRHLASHSECWQTRTFTGVVPKSVLALESEDQLNIYENRVYVKLISNIEKYLVERIAEVRRLEQLFDDAMSFQDAIDIHHEVSQSIFSLWGEGFRGDSDTNQVAENGKSTLNILASMLKSVRALQHTKLYRKLNQNLHIPLKINITNVLSHDQHYRHVARLWHMWLDTQQTSRLDPKHILERNLRLVNSYATYCCDITKRALSELGFVNRSACSFVRSNGSELTLEVNNYSEILLCFRNRKLTLVPWLSSNYINNQLNTDSWGNRVLLGIDQQISRSGGYLCLSPTNFYSLESITTLICQWVAGDIYSKLGRPLMLMPAKLTEELSKFNEGQWTSNGSNLVINRPCGSKIHQIQEVAKKHHHDISLQKASAELCDEIAEIEHLLHCPICATKCSESSWTLRDDNCFVVHNSNCSHQWMLNRQQNGDRHLVARPGRVDSSTNLSFKVYGRFGWDIKMC